MDIDGDFDMEDNEECSDIETYITKVPNQLSQNPQLTNQWQGEGAWDLNWPIGETQLTRANIADPPVTVQYDYDDDGFESNTLDSFRGMYHRPMAEPDFFNSFEDDFDDFDI